MIIALALCAAFQPSAAHAKMYSDDDSGIDSKDKEMGNDGDDASDKDDADNDPNADENDPSKSAERLQTHSEPAVTSAPITVAPPSQPTPHVATPAAPPPVAGAVTPPPPAQLPVVEPVIEKPSLPLPKGSWWHPHPGTKWQIQYAGHVDTSMKVAAYDLDLVDTDPETIKQLHARGVKVMCYFSAGSFEQWRPDAQKFPASIMGKPNGWKDEKWLDIRRIDILKPIMQARISLAAQKGCDAIDPDNVEAFENNSGFPLRSGDQIAYNKMLAELAHAAGMAVGLKNDTTQVEELLPYFDFQVNEQCFEYKACEDLVPFIKANKPVFNIEYKLGTNQFCTEANRMNFDSLKKNLDLDAKVDFCR